MALQVEVLKFIFEQTCSHDVLAVWPCRTFVIVSFWASPLFG